MNFCFLPMSTPPGGAPEPVTAQLPVFWSRPFGVALAAAVAALLHGAVALWYLNRPEPLPLTQAAPLPMIDIALSAPPAPAVTQPPDPPPPVIPREMKKAEPKPVKKPKPKPVQQDSPMKRAEPEEKEAESATPAPAAPPAPVQERPAAPRAEPYTPAVANANYLDNARPVYPGVARLRHWEGLVLLRVYVTPEGRCGELSVTRSSSHEVLDESAMEAVREWRFVPAKRGGTPLGSWVTVPIEFRLN